MKLKQYVTLSAVALATLSSLPAVAAHYKHVSVAPADMAQQALPAVQSKSLFSHSTMLPINLSDLGNKEFIEQKLNLDGDINSPIVLLSPQAEQFTMKITDPRGKVVYDENVLGAASTISQIQVGPQAFSGKQFTLKDTQPGQWTVSLKFKGDINQLRNNKDTLGYLLFKGNSEFQAVSYLDSNFTTKDANINIVAYMTDVADSRGDRNKMLSGEPSLGAIDSAIATVKSPSGKQYRVELNDSGINGDKLAGDGKYSAKMPTGELGIYTNQVQFKGHHANGTAFSRTTTDIYPIAAKSHEFTNAPALITKVQGTKAKITVPVKQLAQGVEVHLSAQLWGTDSNGDLKPAAWIGGIAESSNKGANKLGLNFDTRWLSRAGLQAPYSLKNVRLQTADGNVPLAQKTQIKVKAFGLNTNQSLDGQSQEITQDMLMGKAPAPQAASAVGGKLLLVHGYCSGQAWLESHFSGAVEFKDYKQNISHNTFAQRVRDFGAAYPSFGVVAHSQGGAASLELYSKYWSGLDYASSGNLIQSVGTPYQGTALAGNLAALGDVFGAGCGKNTDLTYSGASNWLSTIPSWAKAKVHYYTTSFTDNWWSYDYCHLATDMFLDDPEDGTTEKWSGQLSGANNKGHKTGQCHTSGMRDPSQTRNTSRNSTMNSNAAR
jgi:pimeloyl-ACP methyl ester carboxylesterase